MNTSFFQLQPALPYLHRRQLLAFYIRGYPQASHLHCVSRSRGLEKSFF
ncbi:hypothetical protein [Fischerella sp. PCC 9605]|nr:hypothetical protein [Fischerella sp. PCC 9605]